MKEKIVEEIKKRAIDNKIPCKVARKIAEDLSVSYRDVGKCADELKVKIISCELGCF